LTINSVGAGPVDFPVGPTSDSLNTLRITDGGGSDYSLRINKDIVPGIAFPTYGINRTWNLKASANTPGVTLRFQFATADANAGVSPTGLLEILINPDLITPGPWSIIPFNYNITATGADPAWLVTSVTTLTISSSSFVAYAIGKNGYAILPLDCIISTRAQKRNNTGIINWSVNSCSEVVSFEVQRSVNNSGFSTIGTVNPVANQTDFSFTDGSLASGTNLYRIKVNRLSSSTKYSNTVALLYNSNDILISSLAPNPVHSSAMMTVSTARSATVDFKVFDMSGHVVKQWQSNIAEGNNTITINVEGLAAGVYHILASSNEAKAFSRFVKQ
ncbi:MAG TPA: T9SS type A sorting domain-containing protein, partial [Chitinophagaceae bacterium]|nr:T9SS type A sorting domain-containing protein [Chitinophagaceae bacterium]